MGIIFGVFEVTEMSGGILVVICNIFDFVVPPEGPDLCSKAKISSTFLEILVN